MSLTTRMRHRYRSWKDRRRYPWHYVDEEAALAKRRARIPDLPGNEADHQPGKRAG